MLRPDLALVGAREAVDRMYRVMTDHKFVARIGMLAQHLTKPFGFDMTFATETRPECVDEDEQQISSSPHPQTGPPAQVDRCAAGG